MSSPVIRNLLNLQFQQGPPINRYIVHGYNTEKVFFKTDLSSRYVVFELDPSHPEDIYKDKFASEVSKALRSGSNKTVFINLGVSVSRPLPLIKYYPYDSRETLDHDPDTINPAVKDKLGLLLSELIYGEAGKKLIDFDNNGNRKVIFKIYYKPTLERFYNSLRSLTGYEQINPNSVLLEIKDVTEQIKPQADYDESEVYYDCNTSFEKSLSFGYGNSAEEDPELSEENYVPPYIANYRKQNNTRLLIVGELHPDTGELSTKDLWAIYQKINPQSELEVLGSLEKGIPYERGLLLKSSYNDELTIDLNGRNFIEGVDKTQKLYYENMLASIVKFLRERTRKIIIYWDNEPLQSVKTKLQEYPFDYTEDDFEIVETDFIDRSKVTVTVIKHP